MYWLPHDTAETELLKQAEGWCTFNRDIHDTAETELLKQAEGWCTFNRDTTWELPSLMTSSLSFT